MIIKIYNLENINKHHKEKKKIDNKLFFLYILKINIILIIIKNILPYKIINYFIHIQYML